MSKYDTLRNHLDEADRGSLSLSFAVIDEIVGGLPDSARRHRAWWANERNGRHVQAAAWLDAGRTVEAVDLGAASVRFSARTYL